MGKSKDQGDKRVKNKHLHARLKYLQQAAIYLAEQSHGLTKAEERSKLREEQHSNNAWDFELGMFKGVRCRTRKAAAVPMEDRDPMIGPGHQLQHELDNTVGAEGEGFNRPKSGLPLMLGSHMRAVVQKSQVRLQRDVKRSFCKVCNTPLIEGSTSTKEIENSSKGGKKPWADVFVVKCAVCYATKRFPVGAKKQRRKGKRGNEHATEETTKIEVVHELDA